jgi:hypothetical protein
MRAGCLIFFNYRRVPLKRTEAPNRLLGAGSDDATDFLCEVLVPEIQLFTVKADEVAVRYFVR